MALQKHSNKQTQTSTMTKPPEKPLDSAPAKETWVNEMRARKRKEREQAMQGMNEQQRKEYLVDLLMQSDQEMDQRRQQVNYKRTEEAIKIGGQDDDSFGAYHDQKAE